jgi:hypothetical protein
MRARLVPLVVLCAGMSLTACTADPKDERATPTASSGTTEPQTLRTPIELRAVRDIGPAPCPGTLTAPAGGALMPYEDSCLAVDAPDLTIQRVTSFEVGADEPGFTGWRVKATLVDEQREPFRALTERLVGRQLAIVVDGTVYNAPNVQAALTEGAFQVSFEDETAARALAAKLTG